jgi:hypothetical protein
MFFTEHFAIKYFTSYCPYTRLKSPYKMSYWTVLTDFIEISYIEFHENTFSISRFVSICVVQSVVESETKKNPFL